MENQNVVNKNSKILITNKNLINICGVTKVKSATETCVSFELGGESTIIEGSNLHVLKLDLEQNILDLEGDIKALKTGTKKSDKNFFKRIFS